MPRIKKEQEALNIRLDKVIAERLAGYCEESGMSKTAVVEKALSLYLEQAEKAHDVWMDLVRESIDLKQQPKRFT